MMTRITTRVLNRVSRWKYSPAIKVQPAADLVRLGSSYGGWTFQLSKDLYDSTILSCGLGEDASFDVEFASRFGARVIMVDPTPRALIHFGEIRARIGQPAIERYVAGGRQSATSYDLRNISHSALILEPSALWIENTRIKFYAPPNPNHVSHSIVNVQNKTSQNTPYIEVTAVTPEVLRNKYELQEMQLMKLDIEGAELHVIRHMMERSILPRQLLVEFDEMRFPCEQSKRNTEGTDEMLKLAGYTCCHFDGSANFLYVLS